MKEGSKENLNSITISSFKVKAPSENAYVPSLGADKVNSLPHPCALLSRTLILFKGSTVSSP